MQASAWRLVLPPTVDILQCTHAYRRVFAHRGATCLVVSHRRPVLQQADHIIVLKDGQVEAEGGLDELLATCEETRPLWHGDVGEPPARPDSSLRAQIVE